MTDCRTALLLAFGLGLVLVAIAVVFGEDDCRRQLKITGLPKAKIEEMCSK